MASLATMGQRIALSRANNGMTQAELAKAAGLQPAAVSHFETGHRLPSAANLRKLCRALDCSADYLLGLLS